MLKTSRPARVCLSAEQTHKAWELEHDKHYSRYKVAEMFYVSGQTLRRMYKRYGYEPPHRGYYKRRK